MNNNIKTLINDCINENYTEAAHQCSGLLQKDPQNTELLYIKATIEFGQDQIQSSLETISQVLQIDPHHEKSKGLITQLHKAIFEHVLSLYQCAEYNKAFIQIKPLINPEIPFLSEVIKLMIKLCIMLKQNTLATNFYDEWILLSNSKNTIKDEIELRLLIENGDPISESTLKTMTSKQAWVRDYIKTQKETVNPADLKRVQISTLDEFFIYTFTIHCKSCGTHFCESVEVFYINEKIFCPHCFAKYQFDDEIIQNYIEKAYPNLLSDSSLDQITSEHKAILNQENSQFYKTHIEGSEYNYYYFFLGEWLEHITS